MAGSWRRCGETPDIFPPTTAVPFAGDSFFGVIGLQVEIQQEHRPPAGTVKTFVTILCSIDPSVINHLKFKQRQAHVLGYAKKIGLIYRAQRRALH